MSEAIIDQDIFDRLKDLVGDDFFSKLVKTFLEKAPGSLVEMGQALQNDDAETFRRSAHSLKSNAASFGVMQLASSARELENLGCDGRVDEVKSKLPQIEIAYQEAAEALRALL